MRRRLLLVSVALLLGLGLALPAGAQEVATPVAPEPVEPGTTVTTPDEPTEVGGPTTLPTTGTGMAASSSGLLVLGFVGLGGLMLLAGITWRQRWGRHL